MTDELVLYYNPQSRARIAHWMLEEVGVPYRIELVDFTTGQHKSPAFTSLNPMGKLPTLTHRGVVVTESAAICAYLADAFPNADLAPAWNDPARGTYFRWLFFGAGCIEPAAVDKAFSRAPVDRPGTIGYGTYDDTMSTIERALAPGPYLLGDRFTAADVYIASQLGWGMMTKAIEPRPAFVAYAQRCSSRPAAMRANAQSQRYLEQLKPANA